ncbi:type II toxin-antitoxin system RatA family toxin [Avibacterium paragallinarum]|uniref:type II toxin-antitoxin system RatA family toxin n=1 Tax=Avibacterium paragallinarum TaxID=728 RepID=UPI00061527CF|nr:type II toxin-antitoxin system RatA family toxin [Avibacterium paragallinarum]QIR11073.1 type II toxin-antitoxin system RatA family toxin [Avibacterium paragallinarum]QLD64190.1 type II toxin-antitoxin system RatA family toxin [Avibacterium paragallinarum]
MPSVNQRALVPYSAKQMYDLVNNYERYPEFVPGCVESRTLNRSERELTAELVISKAGIRQRFTTQNTMVENQQIQMQLVEGPFKFLQGQWQFTEIDEQSCQIVLKLDFEFSNPLIAMAFGQIFTHLTSKMIDAFKQRAKEVYAQ